MTPLKLPTRLQKEPLIDAIFEVRFSSRVPVSGIVPGFLYGKLEGDKVIQELPIAQIPKNIRDGDPNLQYAPVSRLEWNAIIISVSDRSVSIGCNAPYPGWTVFKPAIIQVMTLLNEINVVDAVDRYSMKYVDLITTPAPEGQISLVNVDLAVAGQKLTNEIFLVRVEVPRDNLLNIVQIVSSAKVALKDGSTLEGIVVDIDSIAAIGDKPIPLSTLLENFSDKLDAIHLTNKTMFFDCLVPKTVEALEPVYE